MPCVGTMEMIGDLKNPDVYLWEAFDREGLLKCSKSLPNLWCFYYNIYDLKHRLDLWLI